MNFYFKGVIPASKSIMNRALICSSYSSRLKLIGDSSCDDVNMMKNSISKLLTVLSNEVSNTLSSITSIHEYDCGAAGTTLRFLALRLSRIPGKHILKGTKRLMQRPQKDLLDILIRLGVKFSLTDECITIESSGWKNIDQPIVVQRGVSSQFASSLILNAWNLESDLILQTIGNPISEGYLEMTIQVVKQLGMVISETPTKEGTQYQIKKNSRITPEFYVVESDLSSAFAIAAYAALNGESIFEHFPNPSLQPDFEFINFMKTMGISIQLDSLDSKPDEDQKHSSLDISYQLNVKKTTSFNGLECNLKSCPDLFPVLAILCSFAKTNSRLYGAPQLIHKESNRISKISELLTQIHIPHESKPDGMIISPVPITKNLIAPFSYDTDHDHRLAFAAALVRSQGFPIEIHHPEVVSKSFPEFWDITK